ncbi:hypothetical protein HKX48_005907 [Thoreauomyces humboldtii]|nr:hypothetical protein HKX48_005907 [Thoreauomyces humboldtii]
MLLAELPDDILQRIVLPGERQLYPSWCLVPLVARTCRSLAQRLTGPVLAHAFQRHLVYLASANGQQAHERHRLWMRDQYKRGLLTCTLGCLSPERADELLTQHDKDCGVWGSSTPPLKVLSIKIASAIRTAGLPFYLCLVRAGLWMVAADIVPSLEYLITVPTLHLQKASIDNGDLELVKLLDDDLKAAAFNPPYKNLCKAIWLVRNDQRAYLHITVYATQASRVGIAAYFFRCFHGAPVIGEIGSIEVQELMTAAARAGWMEPLEFFSNQGYLLDAHYRYENNGRPSLGVLHDAAAAAQTAVVRFVLESGQPYSTARGLAGAVEGGSIAIVELLLERDSKAVEEYVDTEGEPVPVWQTALTSVQRARRKGDEDLVNLLIDKWKATADPSPAGPETVLECFHDPPPLDAEPGTLFTPLEQFSIELSMSYR